MKHQPLPMPLPPPDFRDPDRIWKSKRKESLGLLIGLFYGTFFLAIISWMHGPPKGVCVSWFLLVLLVFGNILRNLKSAGWRPEFKGIMAGFIVAIIYGSTLFTIIAVPHLPDDFACFTPTGESTPTGTLLVEYEDGWFNLTAHQFERAVDLEDIRYQLMNGSRGVVIDGNLARLNWTKKIVHEDNGGLGKLSNNDRILIRSKDNGGWADPGYVFRIIYIPTGDVITETLLEE